MPPAAVRTPDERFAKLPDFAYAPHYLDDLPGYEGLRLAYLDEGPRDARHTFLCLHGEPTWSFLYRKMIPVFVAAGGRVVAPDFYGFGRSDKPLEMADYSWQFFRGHLVAFVERLGLSRVTLVCQDWGGVLGLTLPVDHPDLVERLLVMNTALGLGVPAGKGFDEWKAYVARTPDLEVGKLIERSSSGLTAAEVAAYDAPFPDATYKAGVRAFPQLVPVSPDMDGVEISKRAAAFWSQSWSGKTFMAVGMKDPVLGPRVMAMMRSMIRGCPPPLELADAGHFVQEQGDVVARAALDAFGD